MGTRAETVAYLLDVLADLPLSARRMFGEYALYLEGRVVALVCDDQLFLKQTPGAMAALPGCATGFPYPGAKSHLLVTDALDDPQPILAALRAIATEVAPPAQRRRKPG